MVWLNQIGKKFDKKGNVWIKKSLYFFYIPLQTFEETKIKNKKLIDFSLQVPNYFSYFFYLPPLPGQTVAKHILYKKVKNSGTPPLILRLLKYRAPLTSSSRHFILEKKYWFNMKNKLNKNFVSGPHRVRFICTHPPSRKKNVFCAPFFH